MSFIGDSYDIVKFSFLRWLGSFGKWSVHPMFTECVSIDDVNAFERLLGAKIISTEVLKPETDRIAYFECALLCNHLFLDPDTGLRMRSTRGKRGPLFVFASDLIRLSMRRPDSLTLVFDQSLSRGLEREVSLSAKLDELRRDGVFGFAYVSHACFILTSQNRSLLVQAREDFIKKSGLPEKRFLDVPSA